MGRSTSPHIYAAAALTSRYVKGVTTAYHAFSRSKQKTIPLRPNMGLIEPQLFNTFVALVMDGLLA